MSRYVVPVRPRHATGLVRQVYQQVSRDFGAVVEPFALHSPAPALLAGMWCVCRETLLVGRVPRELKEAVAATVSQVNQCQYCVDAHATMLHASSRHDLAASLTAPGQVNNPAGDDRASQVITWARATRNPGSPILTAAPFMGRDSAEFIGTAVAFHYINRMMTVLGSTSPLPAGVPRGVASRAGGWWYARAVRRPKRPGESLALLPEAELPSELGWAAPSAAVAGAFARFSAVVTEAGKRVLDGSVRSLVRARVQAWNGEDPPLSRAWIDEALAGVAEAFRPAARVALLAALAPHQLDESVIARFRAGEPGDETLVAVLAWSSALVATQIGTWLWRTREWQCEL